MTKSAASPASVGKKHTLVLSPSKRNLPLIAGSKASGFQRGPSTFLSLYQGITSSKPPARLLYGASVPLYHRYREVQELYLVPHMKPATKCGIHPYCLVIVNSISYAAAACSCICNFFQEIRKFTNYSQFIPSPAGSAPGDGDHSTPRGPSRRE